MTSEPAQSAETMSALRHQWLREKLWCGILVVVAILAAAAFGANHQMDNAPGPPVGKVPAVNPPPQG